MRDLNYGLKQLVRNTKAGSFGTRAARATVLQQAANTLHDLGYRKLKPQGLKPKHVEALVKHWQARALTAGTIKNRLAHVRWWADIVGKSGVVARDNGHYGVEHRVYVSGTNKARDLPTENLARVTDPHVKMSMRLQAEFGLRREESIKFSPSYADQGDRLVLKASWTKGGKSREIPIRTQAQRQLLDEVRHFAGRGALIPSSKNYVQQMRTYERNAIKADLHRLHGLRHAYAQRRYEELTGQPCPVQGGPSRQSLSAEALDQDTNARQIISREMGHERIAIVSVYVGS